MELDRQYFIDEDYGAARQLHDGAWIAIRHTIFNFSLYVGLDATGWARRYDYLFNDLTLMYEQYLSLKTFDEIPIGWVSKRPK